MKWVSRAIFFLRKPPGVVLDIPRLRNQSSRAKSTIHLCVLLSTYWQLWLNGTEFEHFVEALPSEKQRRKNRRLEHLWSEGRAVPHSILESPILTISKSLPFGSDGSILLKLGVLTNWLSLIPYRAFLVWNRVYIPSVWSGIPFLG